MSRKHTSKTEAKLAERIEALERRVAALERSPRASGETAFKDSSLLRREGSADGKKDPLQERASAAAGSTAPDDPSPPAPGPTFPPGPDNGEESAEKSAANSFEVISVDAKAFERDKEEDRCKFSWKVVVKNNAARPITLHARLEFVDMNSYLIEEDSAGGFVVEPGSQAKLRGFKWISNESEYHIVGARAHLTEEVAE